MSQPETTPNRMKFNNRSWP